MKKHLIFCLMLLAQQPAVGEDVLSDPSIQSWRIQIGNLWSEPNLRHFEPEGQGKRVSVATGINRSLEVRGDFWDLKWSGMKTKDGRLHPYDWKIYTADFVNDFLKTNKREDVVCAMYQGAARKVVLVNVEGKTRLCRVDIYDPAGSELSLWENIPRAHVKPIADGGILQRLGSGIGDWQIRFGSLTRLGEDKLSFEAEGKTETVPLKFRPPFGAGTLEVVDPWHLKWAGFRTADGGKHFYDGKLPVAKYIEEFSKANATQRPTADIYQGINGKPLLINHTGKTPVCRIDITYGLEDVVKITLWDNFPDPTTEPRVEDKPKTK
jgi:hypothetical protein